MGSQYEKNLPPSYNEIFANDSSSVPSAPLMDEYAAQNMPPPNANTGWQPPQGMAPGIPPQLQHTQQQMNAPIYQPQNTVMIIQQIQVGEHPIVMMCPHCKTQSMTKIKHESGITTYLVAGILCLLGWCPCAAMIFCMDCTKDAAHYCKSCNGYIGTYRKSGRRY